MSNQVIKIILGNKDINVQAPSNFEKFKELCIQEFNLDDLFNFTIQYKDDDGDDVNVDNESDYTQSLSYMNEINNTLEYTIKEKLSKSRTFNEINNVEENDPMRSGTIFKKIPYDKKDDESDDDDEKKKEKIEMEMKKYKMELEEKFNKEYEKKIQDNKRENEEKSKKLELLIENEHKKIDEEKQKIEKEKLRIVEELKAIEKKKKEEEERRKKEEEEEEERRRIEEEEKRKKEEQKKKKEEEKKKKEELKKKKEEEKKKKEEQKKKKEENNSDNLSNEEKEKIERKKRIEEKIKQKIQNDINNSKLENQNEEQNNIINNIPLSDQFNSMLSSMKDEYSNQLKKEMSKYIENEVKKLKDDIVKKTLEKNQILISNYIEKLNKLEEDRKNQFQTELSKLSKVSMSSCNTIHNGIKCEKCNKCPIQGIRYKCTICNNYNLCETCEELNSIEKFHNQEHDFIRMRNEGKNIQIPNHNLNDNYNILKNDDDNLTYNYECLTQNPTVSITYGTKQVNYDFIIKCHNSLPWIKGTKLICNKMHSNIICHDIELPELQIGQQTKVCCKFNNLDSLNSGQHKTIYEFFVNNIMYGKPLIINIEIKNNDLDTALNKLRTEFQLSKEEHSDEKLIKLLNKHNNDITKVFGEIFNY